MIGWMGMPDHDGQPTLAEKHPTVANGWVHCLTVPRVLSLDGDALVQWPVAELEALRGEPVAVDRAAALSRPTPRWRSAAPRAPPWTSSCRRPASPVAPSACACARAMPGDPWSSRSTRTPAPRRWTAPGWAPARAGCTPARSGPGSRVDARILLDHSSIEVFVDGGRLAMSARIYPTAGRRPAVLRRHRRPGDPRRHRLADGPGLTRQGGGCRPAAPTGAISARMSKRMWLRLRRRAPIRRRRWPAS